MVYARFPVWFSNIEYLLHEPWIDESYESARYLWCAINHEGKVLETYVTKKIDKKKVLKLMKKAMRWYG